MPKKQSPKTKHLLITNHVFSDKYIPHLALFWSQTFKDLQIFSNPNLTKADYQHLSIPLENTNTEVKGLQ